MTECQIKIVNETICTIVRTSQKSNNIQQWKENLPEKIFPKSELTADILFSQKAADSPCGDYGEVSYEVFDDAELPLAQFMIIATSIVKNADNPFERKVCAHIRVNWDTLPKVFGISVTPRDGELALNHGAVVEVRISGNALHGGARKDDLTTKLTDWKYWQELQSECEPGDIVAVDRGPFRHYGIVEKTEANGTVIISHLSGTAEDVLQRHGLETLREVKNAMTGSHGDIAFVHTLTLEQFVGGKDKCRIENLHDDTWKAYVTDVLLNRIAQSRGHRDYSLKEFNCEHYANLIRYGMPYSAQIIEIERKSHIADRGKEFWEQERLKAASDIDRLKTDINAKREEAVADLEKKLANLEPKLPLKLPK